MAQGQHRRTNQRRKQRPDGEATYDGVTDWMIYNRDGWLCQMPECLRPEGREIERGRAGRAGMVSANRPGQAGDPWRASIDHITPLAEGGRDDAPNKRAAHALCNEAKEGHWGRGQRRLSYTIGDVIDLSALCTAEKG